MIPLPLAFALERAISAGLVLDPQTRERLAALDGKTVRVNVSAPRVTLVLIVNDGRVIVPAVHDAEVDITITGSAAALRSLTRSSDALYRGEVGIQGDIGLGQTLRDIVGALDPDWQGVLSPIIGGAVVHRLERLLSGGARWFERTRGAFGDNTRDWLENEVELVATPGEVESFADGVDDARARLDRLDARLAFLESAAIGS